MLLYFVRPFIDETDALVLVGHGGLYHAMLLIILQNIDYTFMARHPFSNTAYAVAETHPDGLCCRECCGIRVDL